jgi:iron complex transport system substrate-binding protein
MRTALLALVCLSLALLPVLCADSYPKAIVDSANRTVIIDEPVETIVPMVSWSYEPVYILGAGDKVVGVTSDSKSEYPWLGSPNLLTKPSVGTYKELDYEMIVSLNPDLVIAGISKAQDIGDKLEPYGIKVIGLQFANMDMFPVELRTLAEALGEDEMTKAEEFLAWRQDKIDLLKEQTDKISPDEKVRVYGEANPRSWLTACNGTGLNGLINLAGGVNIAEAIPAEKQLASHYADVDPEWVLEQNPQVFILAETASPTTTGYETTSTGDMDALRTELSSRTGLDQTDAVKNDQVYLLKGLCVEVAAHSFVGAYYVAKWLYPEQLKDLDPEALHKEYFEEWLGVPYQGIWAYPQASA